MTLRQLWLMAKGRREQTRRHMIEQVMLTASLQSGKGRVNSDEFAKQGKLGRLDGLGDIPTSPNVSRAINEAMKGNGKTPGH